MIETNSGLFVCLRMLTFFPYSGEEVAAGFQRIPNRRTLPDYFEVISEPVAFSTVRVGGALLRERSLLWVEANISS